MRLSPHFTLEEMLVSQTAARFGLSNIPNALEVDSLRMLCSDVLEPLRQYVDRPIVISSGFRAPAVNKKIGGTKNSQHCIGEAADFTIPGLSNLDVMHTIIELKLPFDQLIEEFGSWIHVSHAWGRPQRGNVLKARRVGGKAVYSLLKES